ncbi:MAG TPA: hypothetical protein VGH91_10360 [Gammaproteobacteria bacterium]
MSTAPKLILACIFVTTVATVVWIPLLSASAIFIGMTALGSLAFIGTPVFLVLRARRMLGAFTLTIAGFLSGLVPAAIWVLAIPAPRASAFDAVGFAMFLGVIGIPCALLYGWIWNLLSARQDRFRWDGRIVHQTDNEQS